VGAGGVNALSGEGFVAGDLKAEPQSYCTVRQQPWLDGIKSGDGVIRQFVATTRGSGASVESQVCGEDFRGGLQLFVCPCKKTNVRFAAVASQSEKADFDFLKTPRELGLQPGSRIMMERKVKVSGSQRLMDYGIMEESTLHLVLRLRGGPPKDDDEMAVAVGGQMEQKVVRDTKGPRYWDAKGGQFVNVHLTGPAMYTAVTQKLPPPTPVDAAKYKDCGYRWFKLYNEKQIVDIKAPEVLKLVKSICDLGDAERPEPLPDEPDVIMIDP